jgi:hypothetical protein
MEALMANTSRRITAEEDAIILNHPHKEACRLLPHRSKQVISTRRNNLKKGILTPGKRKGRFSKEEDKLMREYYPIMGNRELQQKHLPDRGVLSILSRAKYLKLRKKFEVAPPATIEGHKEIVHEIIAAAKERGLASYWLDRLCGTTHYFSGEWRKWPINLAAIGRAAELLGYRLRLEPNYQPFSAESRRLIECIIRFGREDVTKVRAGDVKARPKLAPVAPLKPSADARLRMAISELLPNRDGKEDVLR